MRFNMRWRPRIGPLVFNTNRGKLTSISLKLWRWTHNFKTGRSTFDTPGPGSVSWGGSKRRDR